MQKNSQIVNVYYLELVQNKRNNEIKKAAVVSNFPNS